MATWKVETDEKKTALVFTCDKTLLYAFKALGKTNEQALETALLILRDTVIKEADTLMSNLIGDRDTEVEYLARAEIKANQIRGINN